jgi:RNA polymerase sigma factor (sigma-70 family)
VARSPEALDGLVAVLEEIGEGASAEPDDPMLAARDEKPREGDIAVAARRLRAQMVVASSTSPRTRAEEAPAAVTDFVAAALKHGLQARVLDRLVDRLVALSLARRGSAREALDVTISAIRRHRAAADRAKAVFVEANIGLVVSMAARWSRAGLSLQDLTQEGSLGLMRAVEKFDHRRGIRFSTYASWWIRHSLNRALCDQSRTIRLPVHLVEKRHRMARIARELAQESGHDPTASELSERSGMSEDDVRRLGAIPLEPVSLDAPASPVNDTRLGDLIADAGTTSAIDAISAKESARRIRHLLTTLPSREKELLRLRFGIDGHDTLTLAEIGGRLSLSRERVRQLEARALTKLREQAATEELDSHLFG